MLKIDAGGLDAQIARLRGLGEKQIRRATVAAINDGARAGYEAARNEMQRVFDRPTPWVMGGVQYKKAGQAGAAVRNPGVFDQYGKPAFETLTDDRPAAVIDFDRWGNKQGVSVDHILHAEVYGGHRRYKRHELALRAVGILPDGMYIAPGPGARRDRFGNMDAGQIVQIISWFQGFERVAGARQNMTDKRKMQLMRGAKKKGVRQRGFELFVLREREGKLHPGIYMRKDYTAAEHRRMAHLSHGGATALMYFIKPPTYQQRFDFYGVAGRAANSQMRRSLATYLHNMLRERGL